MRRARRVRGRAAGHGLPGRAVPVPRVVQRRRGARPAPAAGGLRRRYRGAIGAVVVGRPERRARRAGGGDVEGHAAAPGHRAGVDRRSEAGVARRADQRARPRRPPHRARPAAVAARARGRGAPELAPAERGRAGLRPRGDHRPRRGGGCGTAVRARAPARGGGRDGVGRAPVRGGRARGRAADRLRPGRRGRVGLRRAGADFHARGRLSGGGGGVSGALVVVGYALRESLRRRVFLVVLVLTAGFLGLYWLGAREAFDDTSGFATGAENVVDTQAFTGATIFGMAMFATLF